MKKIQLGGYNKGSEIKGYAIVDDEDFEWLNQWRWGYGSKGYAKRSVQINKKTKRIFMHRLIMNTPQRMETDHINHNKLDNRRSNLRYCTRHENKMNKGVQKNNRSGYKGVCLKKKDKKWKVQIGFNRKKYYLGYFDEKTEAAKAYNQKAIELFGEFAYLNKV